MNKSFKLTRNEAAAMLCSAPDKAHFALHVRIDLVAVESEHLMRDMGMHHIMLSRQDAIDLVNNLGSENLEVQGFRIPIAVRKFISAGDELITYWIG